MLRQDDVCKSQLVLTGWRFGKEYGGYIPAAMIMGCIANRVRLGWGSWLEVIKNIPNHAAEETQPAIEYPSIWEPSFVRLLHEVGGIYDGSGVDYAKSALYWADLRRVDRQWFKDTILSNSTDHPKIADCNSLALFR